MRRPLGILLLLALSTSVIPAFAQDAKLSLRAALVDKDLNVKPIPKAQFKLTSLDTPTRSLEITTGFEGTAAAQLAPGKYQLTSEHPISFQGKSYTWSITVSVVAPETTLELSSDNATVTEEATVDDLTQFFKRYQNAVVTVYAEVGPASGTGFIVDDSGLILTNQHVVSTSEFIAVQFDSTHMVRAKLLAADPERDIAVLWANTGAFPGALAAPLIPFVESPAVEGERVLTIGSPLHQHKIMTTGIVSKVEEHAILSDININHGNSGGPLFNSRGKVIGITTFGDVTRLGGPGVAGIVRIEQALPVLKTAREAMRNTAPPPPDLLPNFPAGTYPIEAIKENLQIEKFKTDPYLFGVGDYDVAVITPILRYRVQEEGAVRAAKEKEKRNGKHAEAVQGTFRPLDDLKDWREYIGDYEPVLLVEAKPKLRETFWSAFSRGMAHAYYLPAKMRFKTDFYRMKLFCGQSEVVPLWPGKAQIVLDVQNSAVNVTDAAYAGFYEYPADAINPGCGQVRLELYSEKEPDQPKVKVLDAKTINAVVSDFAPYFDWLKSRVH